MADIKLLIVDDEQSQADALAGFFKKRGFAVFTAYNLNDVKNVLESEAVDICLSDLKLKDTTGAEVLSLVKQKNPHTPVVIMTAYGSVDDAVGLMKEGAFDFIQKPIDLKELTAIISKAEDNCYLVSENTKLKEELACSTSFDNIISHSKAMEQVLNTAARVAPSKAGVLIRGESGTGKELIAKAIHLNSPRKDKPFIVVNCAAMPDTLFESELFGHEKGSFTGAVKQRIGKFEEANGGTLFIDEAGDIPPQIQVKLLRAIQFGEIQRLGSNEVIKPDVRIIAATNRDLEKMISEGDFREDLYYRFNIVTIKLPALRERKEDVPYLIDHFIKSFSEINGKSVSSISKEALAELINYSFPGNIRELENIIQRAVVLSRDNMVKLQDLPEEIKGHSRTESVDCDHLSLGNLNQKVENLEKALINKALSESGGNQVKAAELLEISERTLRYKISKYKIKG